MTGSNFWRVVRDEPRRGSPARSEIISFFLLTIIRGHFNQLRHGRPKVTWSKILTDPDAGSYTPKKIIEIK